MIFISYNFWDLFASGNNRKIIDRIIVVETRELMRQTVVCVLRNLFSLNLQNFGNDRVLQTCNAAVDEVNVFSKGFLERSFLKKNF